MRRPKRQVEFLFALVAASAAHAQTMATPPRIDPHSHNRCNIYLPPEPYRWAEMAANPVDDPISDYATLVKFLSPSNSEGVLKEGASPIFNKSWQIKAKEGWEWTDAELSLMWNAALQGENSNWRREMIPPCTVLGDMMYGRATALVGRPTLVDFRDNGAREAWVFALREDLEAVFFKDCSNPSYRVKIPQATEPVVAKPPEPPKPEPPPPTPVLPDVCKNIPGAKAIPPGYIINEAGNCIVPPPAPTQPPVVVTQPAAPPGRPSNAYAGAMTYVNVNASPQPVAYQPPLSTVARSTQFASIIKVQAEVTVKHVSACEGKACPGWTYGFRNFGQGFGSMLQGGGILAFPFAYRSAQIRSAQISGDAAVAAARERRPDVITISGVNSPTFNSSFSPTFTPTFNPTNEFNPTNTNAPNITPTFNGPNYTPPVYNPPTYTPPQPPVYTPPTYTPPAPPTYNPPVYNPPVYPPPTQPTPTLVDICPNIPGVQTVLPGPTWNIIGGECKPPGAPPARP